MTIYAKQVAPEYQESPLFFDQCFPENIVLTGNRRYNAHTTPEFDKIIADFDEMAREWEHDRFYYHWNGAGYDVIPKKQEYTMREILEDWGFSRADGKPWTTWERHIWRELMESGSSADEEEIILSALALLTGQEWERGEIHGCCQGDWQEIFYPADEWSDAAMKVFETEYFNTGTEWIIHDDEEEPETPEEISGYSVYCTGQNEDDIRQELADASGEAPEDIRMFAFDGWSREEKYREIA